MQFIETPIFTALVERRLSDDEYRSLQLTLVLRPDQGKLIPGSGGLRKLRWRMPGAGKRGGLRLIDYWIPKAEMILMLYLYSKREQGDLTTAQARELGRVAREELE